MTVYTSAIICISAMQQGAALIRSTRAGVDRYPSHPLLRPKRNYSVTLHFILALASAHEPFSSIWHVNLGSIVRGWVDSLPWRYPPIITRLVDGCTVPEVKCAQII